MGFRRDSTICFSLRTSKLVSLCSEEVQATSAKHLLSPRTIPSIYLCLAYFKHLFLVPLPDTSYGDKRILRSISEILKVYSLIGNRTILL